MPELLTIYLNETKYQVKPGTIVAAALLQHEVPCRESVSGTPRAALCGMGSCFECRANIDGTLNRRTCQIACEDGMHIRTQR